MLYYLFTNLTEYVSFFNIFHYITTRSALALLTSLFLSLIFGPFFINLLKKKQKKGQPIRVDGPEGHLLTKQGTPTMGGIMIILTTLISVLLWTDLSNIYIWLILFAIVGFGFIGFLDDYGKVTAGDAYKGLSAKLRLSLGAFFALFIVIIIHYKSDVSYHTHLSMPFFKDLLINLSYFYFLFTLLVILGSANAVNLTDGLDGLAIVPTIIAVACFAIIAYLVGHVTFSSHLKIIYVAGTSEITILCAAIIGAGLGFLWYNAPPCSNFHG